MFRKENITNNDVITRQQIALRKEQLRVVKHQIAWWVSIAKLIKKKKENSKMTVYADTKGNFKKVENLVYFEIDTT